MDPDETVEALLVSATSFGRSIELDASATKAATTILDEGSLIVTVEPGTAGDSVDEGSALTFTVRLSLATDKPVEVSWETEPARDVSDGYGMAEAGVDYSISHGKVTIVPGDTTRTFEVPTIQDTLAEGDEKFQARLTDAIKFISTSFHQTVPLGASTAVGIIEDNDDFPTGLTVTVSPDRVDEGAGPTEITVTVTLDGTSQLPVDTPITVMPSNRPNVRWNATLGEDYTAEPVNTVILAGQMSAIVALTVTPIDDVIVEDGEIIRVSAATSAMSVLDATNGVGLRILDNDEEPDEVRLEVTPVAVVEGAGVADLEITATLIGNATRTVDTMVLAQLADGTAVSGEDYTAASVEISIPAGEMSKTVVLTLTLLDDEVVEGDETVEMSATAQGMTVMPSGVTITIEDDDTPPTGIGLTVTGQVDENAAADLTVTAMLTGGGTRTVDTHLTLSVEDVTAITGDDYSAVWGSASLTIPARQRSASTTLTITPVDDNIHEGPEEFAVRGSNTSPGLTVDGVRHTIADDDPAPTVITLRFVPEIIDEKSSINLLEVRATLEGGSVRTVDTTVTTSLVNQITGDAARFGGMLGRLAILAGETSGTALYLVNRQDDRVDNPDRTFTLTGTASDPGFRVNSANLVITDDDTAGVTISKSALTIEERSSGTYTVVLDSEPTGDVTVTIGGTTDTNLSLDKTSLTFTTTDWDTEQTVTVTAGEDDDAVDDTATLTHTVTSVADSAYDGAAVANVNVTVTDNETAGVTVSETDLEIEEGASASYTVVLDAEPAGDVVVTVGGVTDTDLELDKTSLTFTSINWNTEQTVTVTAGEDDDAVADTATLTHTVTSVADTEYDGAAVANVNVTVTDDETVGVTVHPTAITVVGGRSNEYTVALETEPTDDVTVNIAGFSGTDLSLDHDTLTFTMTNWNTAQTVTVTAASPATAATVTLTHAVSSTSDSDYDGATADDVSVTVLEATAQPLVQAGVTASDQELTVLEGESTTYSLVLSSQPSGDVMIAIEGVTDTDLELDKTSLTFTSINWNTEQTVTVTAGEDDDAVDDTATLTHTVTSAADTAYDGAAAGSVNVTVTDNDTAGVTVSESALTIEEGSAGTYTVVLDTEPTGDVTVTIGGPTDTNLSPDAATLTFTVDDWNTEQTVTVTAGEDEIDAADQPAVTITHTVSGYGTVTTADSVEVTVTDNDTAGVTVSESALTIEEGSTGTYTVVLDTEPTGEVTVTIGGTTDTNLSPDAATLTFTVDDWNTEQTVTVTAGEDEIDADDQPAVTITHTVSGYGTVTTADSVEVTVTDNDTAGVTVSETDLEIEEGASASYTVVLDAEPAGDVVVTVGGVTDTDLELDKTSLTFTADDWSTQQTVTVTAGEDDDAVADTATLTHTVTSVADTEYDGAAVASVNVTVTDDETAGVTVSESALTIEEGSAGTYTVVLDTEPTGDVTVAIGGVTDTDLELDKTSLTFTSINWNTEQTVTVTTGEDDDAVDDTATLTHAVSGYGDVTTADSVDVTVTDDDMAQLFDAEATYRILTLYGRNTDIALSDYLADGVTGVTFALKSCDDSRDDYYDSATVADGRLSLTSNTLGHIHGDNTQTETVCTVTGTSVDGSQDQTFELYTVSARTPAPLVPGDLTLSEARTDALDVQIPVTEGSTNYVRLAWRKDGGQPTFRVVSGVTDETVLTIPGLEKGQEYEVRAFLMTYQSFDLYRVGNSGTDGTLIADGGPAGKWTGNLSGNGLGKSQTITVSTSHGTSLSIDDATAAEDAGTMTFTVTLSAESADAVTVDWATSDGTAVAPGDYTANASGSLTFQPGDTTKTLDVAIVDDDVDEDEEETFTITLSNAVKADLGDATATATGTITDNDDPAVTVSFEQDAYSVAEGSTVEVKVILSADPERSVTIPLTTTDQGGATTADYSGVPANMVFASGETEQTFTFSATQDTVDDDGESVKLGFGALPTGVSAGSTNETTVSITDDDVPSVTASFEHICSN